MKTQINLGALLLILALVFAISGCASETPKDITSSETTITQSSNAISTETNTETSTTIDMDKIWAEQKESMEKEKIHQQDRTLVAKVNDVKIYKGQVEIKTMQNKRNLENFLSQLDTMNISEESKKTYLQEYSSVYPIDKTKILNELIRETVIQLECAKRGLLPNKDEIESVSREHLNTIKNSPGVADSAKLHMEVMGYSEEDYFQLIMDEYKKSKGRENLYNDVTSKVKNDEDKNKMFDSAVDEWVADAKIEIIKE